MCIYMSGLKEISQSQQPINNSSSTHQSINPSQRYLKKTLQLNII